MKLWKVLLATMLVVLMASSVALAFTVDAERCAKFHDTMMAYSKYCQYCGENACEVMHDKLMERDGECKYCGEKAGEEEEPVTPPFGTPDEDEEEESETPEQPVEPKHEGCLKPETCTGKRVLETEKNGKLEVVWECGKLTWEEIPADDSDDSTSDDDADEEKPQLTTAPAEKHEGCLKPATCTGKRLLETEKNGKLEVVWECGKLTWEEIPAKPVEPKHEGCLKPETCNGEPLDKFEKNGKLEVVWPCGKLTWEEIPETGCTFGQHDWCIEAGIPCPICGECGHTWADGVCKWCGEKSPFEVAPECKHENAHFKQIISDPTCTEDGYIIQGEKYCDVCKKFIGLSQIFTKGLEARGHKWVDGVCTVCGEKSPFEVAPDTHKCMAETKFVHNKDGKTHDIVCAECGKLWKNEAHNWETLVEGEWFCLDCGKFTTEDPTHKCMAEIKYVHNKDGKTHDIVCAECGKLWKNEAHNWESLVEGEWFCVDCGKFEYREVVKTKMYYNNTMTSFGPTTRELVGGNDWYRVTPVDLSVDGVYTYDLVASNKYIVGTVTITVNAGALTVEYKAMADVEVKDEVLLVYASKADLAEGKAVTANVGAAINTAETFGEDTKVLVSLILTGNYDAIGKTAINEAAAAELVANID